MEDIDLFIGGLAERPLSGAVVGPTFGCLLGQQFQILKKGDRFWYENNIPPSALSKGKITRQLLVLVFVDFVSQYNEPNNKQNTLNF